MPQVAGDARRTGLCHPGIRRNPWCDLVKYGKVQNRPALGVRGRYIDYQFAFYYQLASGGFLVDEALTAI